MQFADRLNNVETSAIRELFAAGQAWHHQLLRAAFRQRHVRRGTVSARRASAALAEEPGGALQYGATEGCYEAARAASAHTLRARRTSSRQGDRRGADLPGHQPVLPFYGADLVSAPIDGRAVKTDELKRLIAEHRPQARHLIPTFGNPSGAYVEPGAAREGVGTGRQVPDAGSSRTTPTATW